MGSYSKSFTSVAATCRCLAPFLATNYFNFLVAAFFKIEFQWTRKCDKRGSVFHLNVSVVRQRKQFPICSLRARQGRVCDTGSLTHMVQFWQYATPLVYIRTLIPFLILWFTWRQRNAAKYRGVLFSTDGIILEVQRHLRTLYATRTLTSTQWKGDLHQAAVMGFIFRQQVP
ncbi:UNVERIFIED_CONTAM: hypothetical protein Sangu_1175200 [Sesamum angustifolium]|uniref:Uncharacterized protein n=1 Tax=Sesamum angustifolium TaxID=2727405 RepID=A0AAW2NIS2_9LAMI